MSAITWEHRVSPAKLEIMGVEAWPVWEKEVSTFPWSYDRQETCYFLEGEVVVTPEGGEPVRLGRGDLAVFPAGTICIWEILKPVRKHYRLG